jgi:hypothetical protein
MLIRCNNLSSGNAENPRDNPILISLYDHTCLHCLHKLIATIHKSRPLLNPPAIYKKPGFTEYIFKIIIKRKKYSRVLSHQIMEIITFAALNHKSSLGM